MVEDKQTLTKVRVLNKEERIKEIASLLSGKNITNVTMQNAKELLEK